MPLADHFHSSWQDQNHWEGFHSAWANTIVRHLNGSLLPPHFRAVPQVHLGAMVGADVCEIRVHDTRSDMRLVAAVEFVSPGNKDRPENRQAFVSKCAAYLHQRIGLVVVDVVTERKANLAAALQRFLGADAPTTELADLYAVAYRTQSANSHWQLKTWPHSLAVGSPLPTLPLWLGQTLAVPLDLEASYEETRRVLRIA